MKELFAKYVEYLKLERSISPYTIRNYARDVREFIGFLNENRVNSPDKVNRTVLRRYLAWLHARETARPSISCKLSAIRSFYRYLIREEILDSDPLSTVAAPKLEKRLPGFLTDEEILRLVEAPSKQTPGELRDRAILELLYASGLRVSELAAMDLDDITLNQREIRVWGKGSKERIALMGRPAAEALNLYLGRGRPKLLRRRNTPAVFLNRFGERLTERGIQGIVKKYAARAGIDVRVFPHMVRHTFATHLLGRGADLRVVQDLLGHARLSSTQVYTHITQNQLRRDYLAAHPRSDEGKDDPK